MPLQNLLLLGSNEEHHIKFIPTSLTVLLIWENTSEKLGFSKLTWEEVDTWIVYIATKLNMVTENFLFCEKK